MTDNDLAMSQNYIEPPKLIAFINLLKKSKELQEAQFVGTCLCREGSHHTLSLRLPGLLQPELAYSLLGCMGKVSRFSERKAEDGKVFLLDIK